VPDIPHIFIGFDLSLTCTGVVVLAADFASSKDPAKILYEEAWIPPKKNSKQIVGMPRLAWYDEKMQGLLNGLRADYPKDHLHFGIENYGFSETRADIGELGGMVKYMLFKEYGIDSIHLLTPSNIKKFVTGKGNGPKSMMVAFVYKTYTRPNGEPVDYSVFGEPGEDMADAYSVARMAASHWLWKQGLFTPKAKELEALDIKPKVKVKKRRAHSHEVEEV
jgi:hypothetical protein